MLTICTHWEDQQMPPELEWRMWRQIKGAFGVNRFVLAPHLLDTGGADQYPTIEEGLATCTGKRVFLEPEGTDSLETIKGLQDMTLILGWTFGSNKHLVQPGDLCIKIASPNPTDLYGMNAAAIALAYWYGQ